MPCLKTEYCGIELKNPLIAASTGCTKDLAHAKRAEDAGYAAVVLKSVQEELIMRYNPNPRFEILHEGIPGYSATTFYCYEEAYPKGIEEYAEDIRRCKEGMDIPIIASTNCVTPEKWGEYARYCEEAGADALEIVTSCPSGLLMRSAKDIGEMAAESLRETKKAVKRIPVGVKMTMQLTNPIAVALTLQEAGADLLIMYNRFSGCEIDIETGKPIMHGGIAGHGGPWVKQLNMRWILATWPHLHVPVSATGGVARWEDVIKYMMCGASSTQIGSLVYLKGYDYIAKLLDGLEGYMETHGIDRITDIIGSAVPALVDNQKVDRSQRYYASVDYDKCTKCGICEGKCLYYALEYGQDGPVIDKEKCDGCNLCVSLCPKGALVMNEK